MGKEELNYKRDVQINPHKLDKEWIAQPALVIDYNEALAYAKNETDKAKEALEIATANAINMIVKTEEKRPTEKVMDAMITADPAIQKLTQDLIKARHAEALLVAACRGIDQRGQALSNLVKLHGMNYFAEPEADVRDRATLQELGSAGASERVLSARQKRWGETRGGDND